MFLAFTVTHAIITTIFWGPLVNTTVVPVFRFIVITLLTGLFSSQLAAQSVAGSNVDAADIEISAADALTAKKSSKSIVPTTTSGLKPFGSNLFNGGFSNDREDGLNPQYIISTGDRISIRIWGAKGFNDDVTVDHQGNIFIPEIGPVPVKGVSNRNLNKRVTKAVHTKYKENVRVYTSLNGSQPVAVFVTGYVHNPGRFAGIPSNSALHFLDRAGGIDPMRGSYRHINIIRDGETLESIDLYDFIVDGKMPSVQFTDGDTIVVGARSGIVSASGDVTNPAIFEIGDGGLSGTSLASAALLDANVTHVGVSGIRAGEPFSIYVPIDEFLLMDLNNGDEISFRSDLHDKVIVVDIEGAHFGPSRYAVKPNTRLTELLNHIEVDPELSDAFSVSIKRKTIATRQKAALEESLQRLESRYLTASSQTDRESAIRANEAKLIGEFVQRARKIKPNGRLVVTDRGKVADIMLQAGDTITIPSRSDSILLSGEVLVSQAMLHSESMTARDYIEKSGGFTQQADTKRIVLVHANGEVTTGTNPEVRAGDEIIILPKVPVKNLQLASSIVDILYKIAIAASVAVKL